MKAISALNPSKSLGEMPKFSENRRNIQKIYDSVRKEPQDKCHCAFDRSESNANLPDLAVRQDG